MATFRNATGRPLLIETWVTVSTGLSSTRMTRVPATATVGLPPSTTYEWIVYLAEGFVRIGKFRRDAAMDGNRAWTEHPADLYAVSFVPEKDDAAAYYVAWRRPSVDGQ